MPMVDTELSIPDVPNIAVNVRRQIDRLGDKIALRTKRNGKWLEISWTRLGQLIDQAASAMLALGLGEQAMIGIFSPNKPECTIADIAALSIRGVPVYIYPTSTARQAEYIVNDSASRMIFAGTQEQYDKVLSFTGGNARLKTVIAFDRDIRLDGLTDSMYWDDFLELGKKALRKEDIEKRLRNASGDDLLTLIYTSGTTGEPKGVMLTHCSMLYSAAAHDIRLLDISEKDVSLCFLPLSHVFERTWTYYTLHRGMENNYLEDPRQIIAFIREVRPTIMCAVPRFYEKIYAAVFHGLASAKPLKKKLFHWAVAVGRERNGLKKDRLYIPLSLRFRYAVADRLVLKKIRDLVGGRIKFFPCAGAPLAQEIEEFFYAAGLFICYGYGLSETCATVTCHEPTRFRFGLVGKPIPGVAVKIGANDEILVRGATVMKGYYNKPEETAAVFENGWLKTGDAGTFESNGELRITDRIKDLMKTSGGKYIAPQLIETTIGSDHYIEQILIVADSRRFVTALIVPEFEALEAYAKSQNIDHMSRNDLIAHPQIIDFIQQRVEAQSKELANFEKVIRFTLLADPFTIDNGEITPTMKLKRRAITDNYAGTIEAMYRQL